MDEQQIERLRSECMKFFMCETLEDSLELVDIYSEFLYRSIINHHKEPVQSYADADAKMIVQMMLTKTLHLKSIVEGISFESSYGTRLNKIVDPTIVASMIRNVYETTGMFNLIYRNSKTSDEKTILYYLWVYSGLKYRQRFERFVSLKENKEKMVNEKKQLENLSTAIKETELYQNLDQNNKNIIDKKIKEKSYLLTFNGHEVIPLHWQGLTGTIGIKTDLFDDIYTYFSLYSHPSNVAVFQFSDMFDKAGEPFKALTNMDLRYFFSLMSFFIADLIYLFPNTLKTYESLNIRDQIVINFYNTSHRGYDYSINDSWKIVD
jgi:hypothetical protein